MKKNVFTILFSVVSMITIAQKHNNIWLLGSHNMDTPDQPMTISFGLKRIHILNDNELPTFDFYCSSMCDSFGDLLFYSNGLHIYNKEHKIMTGGFKINPGIKWDNDSKEDGNYGSRFGGKSIPYPNHPNEYIHFHIGLEPELLNSRSGYAPMYYSRIDMSYDKGIGACIEKNVILAGIQDRYTYFDLVKHANGRDWWLIILKGNNKDYFRYLISPIGITKKKLTLKMDFGVQETAWLSFSPDGTRLILYESTEQFSILDFDRCTGKLSNQRIIPLPSEPRVSFFNLAFSPNSQYLYIGNVNEIYQVNLKEEDLSKSVFCITESDRYIETFSTSFIWSQLAPDGKIYITSGSSNKVLHVINRPNLPGMACDVQQHGIELPSRNFLGIPRFPNYRLGALEGSECDTLQGVVPKVEVIDSTNGDFKFAGKWYKRAFKP